MASRIRPAYVTVGFAVLFAVIANLSWATALTTAGPWFNASVSLQVYTVAIGLASLLAVVLVHHATAQAESLEASLRRLDRRVALLRATPPDRALDGPVHHVSVPHDPEVPTESDLEALADADTPALVALEKEGHDTLVSVPAATRAASRPARTEVLRMLVRERIAVREARARVWTTAAGPVLLAVIFLAIAGPMLPGVDGFATAHYQLNTALILFLAYGFAPLVAWSVLSLGMIGSAPRRASL